MCCYVYTHTCDLSHICFCLVHIYVQTNMYVILNTRICIILHICVSQRYIFVHVSSHALLSHLRQCLFVDEVVVHFYEYINTLTYALFLKHAYVCICAQLFFICFHWAKFAQRRVFEMTLTSECVFLVAKTQCIGQNKECICCNCQVLCM